MVDFGATFFSAREGVCGGIQPHDDIFLLVGTQHNDESYRKYTYNIRKYIRRNCDFVGHDIYPPKWSRRHFGFPTMNGFQITQTGIDNQWCKQNYQMIQYPQIQFAEIWLYMIHTPGRKLFVGCRGGQLKNNVENDEML